MSSSRSRRLGKAVLATLMLSALTACGGGGGSGSNNNGGSGNNGGGGTVIPPAPTLSRLTLTGTVTDAPIANAVVTATIGSQAFTATADANGNYSVEVAVEESATGGFITLTAKGAGSQSYVEFTSLVGAFNALKTQAGSDSILSSSENFATQITNVSTALAVLLRQANGGQPVNSPTLIETLSSTLNGQQLLELATAIKLLVDQADDYPMPAGQTSLQALLTDTTAREQLVTDVYEQDPAAFNNTSNAIVADSTLTQPITAATLPSALTAVSLNAQDAETYAESDRAVSYTFNTDGTGTASTGTWHRNMTWSISGASVEIAYERGLEQQGYQQMICPQLDNDYTYAEYDYWYTLDGATLTLLNGGVLATTESRHIAYPSCGLPDTLVVTVARNILAADDFQPIDIAELRDSTRTLWVYDASADVPVPETPNAAAVSIMPDVAELHADGTGSTLTFGKQFTWSLDNSGRVVNVTFDDGVTAKFRSLRELDDVATDVMYEFTLPTGRRVDASASLRVDTQLAFTTEQAIGRHYRFGIGGEGLPPAYDGFRYRFDADGGGSGEFETTDQNGLITVARGTAFQWNIDGNDLVFQYTITAANDFNCDLADPLCYVYRTSRIIPLARDGSRTYWLESSRRGFDRQSIDNGFSRANGIAYYDHEPFGAPAVINSKAPAARTKTVPVRRDSHIARGLDHKFRN
jgi:hypothetical protein